MADLRTAQAEVHAVKITDDTIDALIQIRDACKAEGIVASDRRWKKSLRLAQAVAYMAGEKKTSPEDLAILVDSLWREPKDRPKVKAGSLGHRPLYFPNLAEIFGGPGGTRTRTRAHQETAGAVGESHESLAALVLPGVGAMRRQRTRRDAHGPSRGTGVERQRRRSVQTPARLRRVDGSLTAARHAAVERPKGLPRAATRSAGTGRRRR